MSKDLNRTTIIGNTGKDCKISFTTGGTRVARVSVATNRQVRTQDEQIVERTTWHNVVLYGRMAEVAEMYTAKGSRVYIEGRSETREYTDEEGTRRLITEIIAQDLILLGDSRRGEEASVMADEEEIPLPQEFEESYYAEPAPVEPPHPVANSTRSWHRSATPNQAGAKAPTVMRPVTARVAPSQNGKTANPVVSQASYRPATRTGIVRKGA
jgi:single-strand DNA-binding protein